MNSTTVGLEWAVARHIASSRYEDLSPMALEGVRRCVLDTLGCTIAGSSGADIERLAGTFADASPGAAAATSLVFGRRLQLLDAVWLNGAMARAREFDDSHDASGDHSSAPVLAAALGAAEAVGSVSGRTFMTAYAVGVDVAARLRLGTTAMLNETGFAANTYAPFAAAATAAVILGLNEQQTYDALGWAFAQCAGSVQAQQSSGSTLHIHHGLASASGVRAALLAREDLPGTPEFLTGRFGFFNNYCKGGLDEDMIRDGLGERYEVENISVKLYPSGRVTHGAVDAALELFHSEQFAIEDVESVKVFYSQLGYTMTCQPASKRRFPTEPHDATFSLYHNVASALAHGSVSLSTFEPEGVDDPVTRAFSEKLEVVVDDSIKALAPVTVRIELRDGTVLSRTTEALLGSPANPVPWERYVAKFRDCVEFSARPLPRDRADSVAQNVEHLEGSENAIDAILPDLVVSA